MRVLLLLVLGLLLWRSLHWVVQSRDTFICRHCGSSSVPKLSTPRNLFIEIMLWFCGLFPGVIYTLWCNHESHNVCRKCASRDIVPLDSPVGRQTAASMAMDVTHTGEPFKPKPAPLDATPMSEQVKTWR